MEITVSFPGGQRVDAEVGAFTIHTDQRPQAGGDGSAPEPYTLFLAALAACAGAYVNGFCRNRDIPVDDIRLVQSHERDPETGALSMIRIEIRVPESFPERYLPALERVADKCAVKKTILDPPQFSIEALYG